MVSAVSPIEPREGVRNTRKCLDAAGNGGWIHTPLAEKLAFIFIREF